MGRPKMMPTAKLRLGISSCLLGERVRYNGDHKLQGDLIERLASDVEWLPICPELESGMGVPREPVELFRRNGALAIRGVGSGKDWTGPMREVAQKRINELEEESVCGYIVKARSPSCGLGDVSIEGESASSGFFTDALIRALPLMPVDDEQNLSTAEALDNFLERAFAYRGILRFLSRRRTRGELMMFHNQRHRQVSTHSPDAANQMRELVGSEVSDSIAFERYFAGFMQSLRTPARRDHHVLVMTSALQLAWTSLEDEESERLRSAIQSYAASTAELCVPHSLLRSAARKLALPQFEFDTYLDPSAEEERLRNLSC